MDYESYLKAIAPPWLSLQYGQALLGGIGAQMDDLIDRLKQAVKARFPEYAPSDALPAIGSERQIDQGPTEANASYAARLKNAWDAWQYAGAAYGILRQLWEAGLTTAQHVQMNGRVSWLDTDGDTLLTDTLETTPYVFGFDPPLTFWSKFAIFFPLGTTALTTAQQDALRTIVNRWKRASATYVGASLVTSGTAWGVPIETWANDGNWGSGTVTNYAP